MLERAGLTLDDVGLFELNEPFAVQVLTWCDGLGVDPDDQRLNPYGGAIACGHPLAATGVRLAGAARVRLPRAAGRALRPDGALHRDGHGRGRPLGEPRATCLSGRSRRWLPPRRSRPPRGPVALVTIDNGADWQKPNTFGRAALESLDDCWRSSRAATGRDAADRQAVRLRRRSGHRRSSRGSRPSSRSRAAAPGHELFGRIRALPFPTVAAINGACLGGGVEIALHCDYRTISTAVRHFACPRSSSASSPAGAGRSSCRGSSAPRRRSLHRRRTRCARTACSTAARRSSSASPTSCSSRSSSWTSRSPSCVSSVETAVATRTDARSHRRRGGRPQGASAARRPAVRRGAGAVPRARPDRGRGDLDARGGLRQEEEALAELLPGRQAQASLYAFDLVERRAKRGVGLPDAEPRRIEKVGIVGAG